MPDNRVFFLGAGASYDIFRLPLMDGFVEAARSRIEGKLAAIKGTPIEEGSGIRRLSSEEADKTERFIRLLEATDDPFQDFGYHVPIIAGATFESMLTQIEVSLDDVLGAGVLPGVKSKLREVRSSLITLVEEGVALGTISDEQVAKLDSLFGTLLPSDTVVTTNYDVGFELYVEKKQDDVLADHFCDIPRCAISQDQDEGAADFCDSGGLVKLHGSANWYSCTSPPCPAHHQINVLENLVLPPDRQGASVCGLCGNPKEAVILPPVANKPFQRYRKFGLLWRKAFDAIRMCDELVVFGFSAAPVDFQMRWLLGNAAPDSLSIIDPNQQSRESVLSTFASSQPVSSRGDPTTIRQFSSLQEYASS